MTTTNLSASQQDKSRNTTYRYPFLDLSKLSAHLLPKLEEAALRVIRSGRYIGGPEVEALEERIKLLTGARHVIAVSNGYDALRLILRAYIQLGRLNPGDIMAVPANTFAATSLAVADAGLIPWFIEPDKITALADLNRLDHLNIPDRCRGLMSVDLYGRTPDGDALRTLAGKNGWLIVEDAAQSIGARSKSSGVNGSANAGNLAHAGAFSFYPTKNAGALGDAGAVLTCDKSLAEAVHCLANYGSAQRYNHVWQGANCRMDPIQAAMLCVKLDDLPRENNARATNAQAYHAAVTNPIIQLPPLTQDTVWHQFVVQVTDGSRDRFRAFLAQNGVQTDIHYPVPCHLQPCHTQAGSAPQPLPVAEWLAHNSVSLPISSATSPQEIREIAEIINRYN